MENKKMNVRIGSNPKLIECFSNTLNIKKGDMVVIETSRGVELGQVVSFSKNTKKVSDLFEIKRIATSRDKRVNDLNKSKSNAYLVKIKQHIKKLNLEMKVVSVEFTLDFKKIIISFYSETRVDFRELVKTLANDFKMKIELKQVGARDVVQIMGGIGLCGQECCCHKFASNMEPVSIKMAKQQGLSLNPTSISGLCGKLLCCLEYENSAYQEIIAQMPKINSLVKTPDGEGKVVFNNILKRRVQVRFEDDIKEYSLSDIKFSK